MGQPAPRGRAAPRRRADGDGPNDRRDGAGRAGDSGPGGRAAALEPAQAHRGHGDPPREPGAGRLRPEGRRTGPHGPPRARAGVRPGGGRLPRRQEGEDQAERRARDPLRGPEGRPGHARDAGRDGRAPGGGPWGLGRAAHGRPLLGRHLRLHGGARGPGGGGGRPHRGHPERRHDRLRRQAPAARRGAEPRGDPEAPSRREGAEASLHVGGAGEVLPAGRIGLRGRRHRLTGDSALARALMTAGAPDVDAPAAVPLVLALQEKLHDLRRDLARPLVELGLRQVRDRVGHEEEPVGRARPTARPSPGR